MPTTQQHGEPIATESADITAERLAQLKQLFPEAFSEGRIDFEKLRAALGDLVDDRPERYQFTWAGKKEAIRLLQTPTNATLLPAEDESVNWDTTQHLFIEGDNLEVLKLLYKSYFGRVKMIYIDPPYNTGNDFIYPDDFRDPLAAYERLTGQRSDEGDLLTSNRDTGGRFHSAWLTMMYPRLFVARQLLRDDGVIFISIDDNEVHNLRLLMNEIFGEENFVASVVWQKRTSPDSRATLGPAHDYVLVFARSMEQFKETFRLLPLSKDRLKGYKNPDDDPRGPWASVDLTGQTGHATPSQFYEITTPSGITYKPPEGRCWALAKSTFNELVQEGRIWFGSTGDSRPRLKRYLSEVEGMAAWTWWPNDEVGHNQEATKELNKLLEVNDIFNNPKPTRLLERTLLLTTHPDEDDIILDFFSGSCTTAQAVLELNREDNGNRRFIMVQLPEPITRPLNLSNGVTLKTIADIGKERIRRVIEKMQAEDEGKLDLNPDEDLGFKVFKLAPSHLKPWAGAAEPTHDEYTGQMELFSDPLEPGWTVEGIIYEVALKEGYSLTSQVTGAAVAGHAVYKVTDPDRDQQFHICLDDSLSLDVVDALSLDKDDMFVCRDVALDDSLAANLALQCRLKII